MITYTVEFKNLMVKTPKWEKIEKIKGDGMVENSSHRFFITEDEERYEVPIPGTIFKFSKERYFLIKERMELEARQNIQIDKG